MKSEGQTFTRTNKKLLTDTDERTDGHTIKRAQHSTVNDHLPEIKHLKQLDTE